MTRMLLLVSLLLLSHPIVAQDLPPDILADQYLLEATRALEQGDSQRALEAYTKIEALDTVPPPEFSFFYGKLLLETSTAFDDLLKAKRLLTSYVIGIAKESEYYRRILELLSMADEKLALAEAEVEASRTAAEATRRARFDETIASLIAEKAKRGPEEYFARFDLFPTVGWIDYARDSRPEFTLLGYAVAYDYAPDVVTELIARGHGVNETDDLGNTPLHYAAYTGSVLVYPSRRSHFSSWPARRTDVMRALLGHGGDLSAVNNRGFSPLSLLFTSLSTFSACVFRGEDESRAYRNDRNTIQDGLLAVAALFLRHGADVNGSVHVPTPLMWAAAFADDNVVEFLIENGALLDIGTRESGRTILDVALSSTSCRDTGSLDRIVQVLLANGAKQTQ